MSLTIKVYDVEHGSCTHIITPNNQHTLIDLGRKGNKSICEHLRNRYFKHGGQIDHLVLTHLHEDHIKDLPKLDTYQINPRVLSRPTDAFDLSYKSTDSDDYKAIVNKANKLNCSYTHSVNTDADPCNPNYNGGAKIKLFAPDKKYHSKDDLNSYSLIITLEYGNFKFIFTGDNPAAIMSSMITTNRDFKSAIKDATVLLAPHHGRDGEFCKEFLDVVKPQLTVFSDSTIKYKTQEYSAQKYRENTRGVNWNKNKRYVLTTRNDGTITFELHDDESWSIGTNKEEY